MLSIIKIFKDRLKCEHDWIKEYMVRDGHDYSGFYFQVWQCVCKKCGNREIRKYW